VKETATFSFGLLRLLIFTAAVGATCAVSKLVEERNSVGVWLAGGAISLLVLVARRKDLPGIFRALLATIFVLIACLAVSTLQPVLAGIAAFVMLLSILAAFGWLR
jgi:hypothetical protein